MKYLIPFFLLLILSASSCKKNKTSEQLPPETRDGKFTFGCKVNGTIFTSRGQEGLFADQFVSYSFNSIDSIIYISAKNSKTGFNFDLTIKYSGKPGQYLMKGYPYRGIFNNFSNGTTIPDNDNEFTTNENFTGVINVTFFNGTFNPYSIGTILSGTFEMEAINNEGKVIHITEGRFDIGQ